MSAEWLEASTAYNGVAHGMPDGRMLWFSRLPACLPGWPRACRGCVDAETAWAALIGPASGCGLVRPEELAALLPHLRGQARTTFLGLLDQTAVADAVLAMAWAAAAEAQR